MSVRWSPPEGAVDVVALQFGRDGADLVQLVTLSDEGQPDIRALLLRTPEGPEVTRVALVPRPTGCGLEISRWRGARRVALDTFDLPGQTAQASNK